MKATLITGALLLLFMQASALEMEFNIDIDDTNGLPAAMVKTINQAYDLNMKGLELLDKKKP